MIFPVFSFHLHLPCFKQSDILEFLLDALICSYLWIVLTPGHMLIWTFWELGLGEVSFVIVKRHWGKFCYVLAAQDQNISSFLKLSWSLVASTCRFECNFQKICSTWFCGSHLYSVHPATTSNVGTEWGFEIRLCR